MLVPPKKKNRNLKHLALNAETAKPGTLSDTPIETLLNRPLREAPSRPSPVQLSARRQLPSEESSLDSVSRRSSYHSKLSKQIASLEIGVEFKLDLRPEDVRVVCELGSGNGGTVSRAVHVPTQLTMAKKVVHLATSESTRKQILRELQIMHDCSSPYIVSFYGAYLQDPHICMCMEFMDKDSFDKISKKYGALPEAILGMVALSVVSGLHYLYEVHKIMHRDVKPSNILLNSSGQIKICDFGVSGQLINSIADTFVGTSTYMSPERIQGTAYSVKSDVWSLGITLIELAIGNFPFSSAESDTTDDDDLGMSKLRLQSDSTNDQTLQPVRPNEKSESVRQADQQREAKQASEPRGHQMSILELLQYIVNEPAPRLPPGRFSPSVYTFVDAMLRKEPEWNTAKQGPMPTEIARPTPSQLMEYEWMAEITSQCVDVKGWIETSLK